MLAIIKIVTERSFVMIEIKGNKETDHLILKYDDKAHCFVDKTKEIFYLKDDFTSWRVGFTGITKKYYNVSKEKMMVSTNPIDVNFEIDNVYINGKKEYNVYRIIKFDDLGYKIIFRNYSAVFVKDISVSDNRVDIALLNINVSRTGNMVFDYYKTLADYAASMSYDETSVEKLLNRLYCKIKQVDESSVLYDYSQGEITRNQFDFGKLIYPFNTNASQMKAVKQTFSNKLSVISGPPGTGKTQVILNIICNAIINGMKIAVISNNNTAVKNVYDKMQEEDLDFCLANLGNRENVDNFFSRKDNLDERIKDLEIDIKTESVSTTSKKLEMLYDAQNKLKKAEKELLIINEEYDHYKANHKYVSFEKIRLKDCEAILNLKTYLLSKNRIGLFAKIKLRLKYRIKKFDLSMLDDFISFLEFTYYEKEIKEYESIISEMKAKLSKEKISDLIEKQRLDSKKILNNYLYAKYSQMDNCNLTADNYLNCFDMFVKRYPVILSTTHSLLRNVNYGFKFDLVVIDEASQSDIMTTLLTMNVAKNMVAIGDSKQLPQIDNEEIYDAAEELNNIYNIAECYRYKDNSILHSVLSLKCKVENTILREHYRCDARIIEFCNQKFYDNKLIICTETSDSDPLCIVHTVEGNHARKNPNGSGQYNDREAQEILNIIEKCGSDDIGIITPFRAQADYINELIKDKYPSVEVDTIHKYQGRQKKTIILSTVVNDLDYDSSKFITDFVTNSKLLNVAISRAIDKLYLVVSDKVYSGSGNTIAQFIDYIKYHCKDSSEFGKVTSIFDKLYDVSINFNSLMQNKYVDSAAELLMKNELDALIPKYKEYKYVLHYRLRDLIKHYDGFNEEEIRYITHPKTHVDFVIFDKITYRPVLCIEVDGVKYHDYAKRQIEHDKIKDRILESNGINILRLKTNQSGEIEKIKKYL